ncbi:hypothetical protein SSX86_029609 [Deinandra increscens subsp. villosa]|uniref:Uncharacterized protein n=1 Tax=Deinandra increscens subsp. villosa TaxID=3103831 RepID=A0AAP0GLY1_9ASTR
MGQAGDPYDDRRYLDERLPRDDVYSRNAFQRDVLAPPPVGGWPQARRRIYEDEYPYRDGDHYDDGGYERPQRYGGRDRDDYAYDDYDYRPRVSQSREDSRERDYDGGRHSYDSDYDRGGGRREGSWRRRDSRDRKRDLSPYKRHERSRSRSHGHEDRVRSRSRSRTPRSRSRGRSYREDSYDEDWYDRSDRRRDHDKKRHHEYYSAAPSATVVVKGLSQKTTEEDLYQILAEWGPLRHVRVIKERSSGMSRGFAFIDFPTTGSARSMMDKVADEGLIVDGRKLFFEYSSKPGGGAGGPPFGSDGSSRAGHINHKTTTFLYDWMCTICGCVNFARRTSCFQCNEPRTEDAPPADMASSNHSSFGKKGETGPTHVLVVRGLDENADEEMLRYEFSKHAPIKDLRLVRDKFTHVSRGFAFVHFHSVDDATKALEATNGTTFEKNGQTLRVAYAKSILGAGSGTSSHSSSLAAAAIEAAAFSQQYDAVGWAPKEYNPDDKQPNGDPKDALAPQSGFVWDEASGYYYDAASGFYYDGNTGPFYRCSLVTLVVFTILTCCLTCVFCYLYTGLYYDGNNGIWYSYDNQSQQYVPCNDQNDKASGKENEPAKSTDGSNTRKVVISAPAATISSSDKTTSLPDAVQAAAAAAIAAEKKEKERLKEIRLASKSSILASKKKMSNVLSMWKQRSHESQAPRVALDGNSPSVVTEEKPIPVGPSTKGKIIIDNSAPPVSANTSASLDAQEIPRPAANISGGTLRGVIRGSTYVTSSSTNASTGSSMVTEAQNSAVPFRTDASALGSYTSPAPTVSGKRRFSELPVQSAVKEQSHTTYRDRAAERRSLYGSSFGDDLSDLGAGDPNRESALKRGGMDSMPFPPGVGGRGGGGNGGESNSSAQSYDVITAEKAIDETNVGNRMLRNMGWQEGLVIFLTCLTFYVIDLYFSTQTKLLPLVYMQLELVKMGRSAIRVWVTAQGLGKDGSGMVEPVQAQATEKRAGLGSQPKKLDPSLEVQAGDSYRTLIQKKALARFREMS